MESRRDQDGPGARFAAVINKAPDSKPPCGAQMAPGPGVLQSLIRRLLTKRPFGAQMHAPGAGSGPGLLQSLIRRLITQRPFGACNANPHNMPRCRCT